MTAKERILSEKEVRDAEAIAAYNANQLAINTARLNALYADLVALGFTNQNIAAKTIVLHCLGQSNMIGWGTSGSIDRALDKTDFRIKEVRPLLAPNLISNANFESGVGAWAGSNASLVAASNKLTATLTSNSFANASLAVSGLEVGQTYIMSAKIGGTANKSLTFRLTAPQTQAFITPKDATANYIDFQFVPSATTATLFLITTNTGVIGDTFTLEDVALRKIVDTTKTSYTIASEPLTWPLASQSASWGVCPIMQAARDLLARGASQVVINPLAVGGQGLYNSTWAVGGTYQQNAVDRITKVQADYPNAIHILLWCQGEQDVLNGVSQANYQSALTATWNSFRVITGLSNAKIINIELMPEFQNDNAVNSAKITAAQRAVVAALANAVSIVTPSGYTQPDRLHFNALGSRAIGSLVASAI